MLYLKIDVQKIEKDRLYKGKKGTYLDAVLLENRNGPDQYGNTHMIIQSVSQEERAKGIKGPIIGNAKSPAGKPAPRTVSAQDSKPEEANDDVPF